MGFLPEIKVFIACPSAELNFLEVNWLSTAVLSGAGLADVSKANCIHSAYVSLRQSRTTWTCCVELTGTEIHPLYSCTDQKTCVQ